jgi:hypothetical protein
MSDDWAKEIANKIRKNQSKEVSAERASQIVKAAEDARQQASDILFNLFIDKVDAGLLGFFRRRSSSDVLSYAVSPEQTFRFQVREAYGTRLEIEYNRDNQPSLRVDVATYELVNGDYLPIFRDSGAVAGAQIWQEKKSERKHPELIARLFLVLSAAAVEEKLKIKDSVRWVYESDNKAFTDEDVQKLIENLIASA